MNSFAFHDPVLLNEAVEKLDPQVGDRVLDVTAGLGGHAEAFLRRVGGAGEVVLLDADSENLEAAKKRLSNIGKNFRCIHTNFASVGNLKDIGKFDVIFADLGVSSPHFDDPSRGFTFRNDAPLDMRYDRTSGRTVQQFLAQESEDHIADVLKKYAEIPGARKLAIKLKQVLPGTTQELRDIVQECFSYKAPSVLPQVFQAFRIAVNQEMEALEALIATAPSLLKVHGRFGVISYHSLEDRIVKHAFRSLSAPEIDDRTGAIAKDAPFKKLHRKPIQPSEQEIERNPRSRSAKFRVLLRTLPS